MIDVWEMYNYGGKVKIKTNYGKTHIGKVCLVEDVDEDDDYESECVFIDCDDGAWAIFRHEMIDVEFL